MKYRLYWFLPLIIFLIQLTYTLNTFDQIRYEELEESVVNPYWFENRLVQNGATSNLSWYFLMALIYKIFGFSLFASKFVKLGLFLVALFCLASLLKKYLGEKLAWLPLLTIGLSPTLLYFNTIATTYALDISFFIISLFLLDNIDFAKTSRFSFLKQWLFFSLLMFAWLVYPSFIYYLPAFLFILIKDLRFKIQEKKSSIINHKSLIVFIAGFVTPLILVFFFIKNRELLIYDQVTKSGILRGAGFLRLDFSLFLTNLKLNLTNLFLHHFGYYYEINKVEFSDFYPILGVVFVIALIFRIFFKSKKLRLPVILIGSIFFMNILLGFFSVDPTPGMRRYTGELAAFYLSFVLVWFVINKWSKKQRFKKIAIFLCSLILIHHIAVIPTNYLHLADPSQFQETVWFKSPNNPSQTFAQYLETVQKEDLRLICLDSNKNPLNCRYSEVFAAVNAACFWNHLVCYGIYGYDLKTKQYIKLNIKLFNDYYFGLYGREIIAT